MIFVWTAGDVLWIGGVGIIAMVTLIAWIAGAIRQARCKHDGYIGETRACEATCSKCGKNLGFIGTWREKHPT